MRQISESLEICRQTLRKGELWNHSYYLETIGDISEETIRKYIEHQSKQY
nr:MAG TPA: transposase [Bacteriophage sp.]